MKMQKNLSPFNKVIYRVIYNLIVFTIAYIPISVWAQAVYDGCEIAKAPYIQDNLCKIEVTNCKENGTLLQVPEGSKIVATCNVFRYEACATIVPRPPNCEVPRCPTDPNECANDDETDGVANYTNTQITGTVREESDGTNPPVDEEETEPVDEEQLHSCEKTGETTIEDHKCQMRVTACKRGNEDAIPPGAIATAICNTEEQGPPYICNRTNPPGCRASCPTDPNECANDDSEDNIGNYSNTETINFTGNTETLFSNPNSNRRRNGNNRGTRGAQ